MGASGLQKLRGGSFCSGYLGVMTVGDRIAQMVVKQMIEPDLEPIFLTDSYGYRPRKSALDVIRVTRQWYCTSPMEKGLTNH